MISSSKYSKKVPKILASSQKKQLNCQKQGKSSLQSGFSQISKIKSRADRQKPSRKDQIRHLNVVRKNDLLQQPTPNENLSIFSKKDKKKFKINIKKSQQYLQKVNQNGFSNCPPTFTQIIPPIFMFLMIFQLLLLTFQCMEKHEFYIALSVTSLLLLLIVYFWYKTTWICPTDSIQLQHLQFIKCPQNSSFQPHKHKYFCNICKTYIGQLSFHCNKCNRCVEYFDHHCKWVNNCIGSKNNIEFIHLLVWSWLFMVFYFIWNWVLIYRIVKDNEQLPRTFWYAVTMSSILLIPFIALSYLLFLHLYLIVAKRTTLEMILQSRKKHRIYPQNSSLSLAYKKKSIYIPDESPINSPTNFTQNSALNQIDHQHNQSLLKFMQNLTNNLKIGKKPSQQAQTESKFMQNQKKISFKPTILKKNTYLKKNQTKITTQRNIKFNVQPEYVQNDQKNKNNNNSQDSSEIDLQLKNTNILQLRFSAKSEIQDDSLKSQINYQIEKQNYCTERKQTLIKGLKQPRKLNPINKIQTQKKLRFKQNNQKSDFQGQKFDKKLQNGQIRKQESSKGHNILDESQNQIQVTKLFQVNSLLNQSSQDKQ